MFDKEGFIADYIEAVRKNSTEDQQKVLSRLTADEDWELRKELVQGIIAGVKELEGDYATHIEFLNNQLQLIEAAKMHEQRKEDSANEDAKEGTKAEEVTQDVDTADVSAEEAEGERTESAATETEVESGGYAPTTEEKTEKSEESMSKRVK